MVAAAVSPAAAQPVGEAAFIWNGLVPPGAASELVVRVEVPGAGAVTAQVVDAHSGALLHHHRAWAYAAGPLEMRVPLAPGERQLAASVALSDTLLTMPVARAAAPTARPLVAIARSPSDPFAPQPARLSHAPLLATGAEQQVLAADLPHYPASYAAIDLLVLDAAAFAALSHIQRRALEQFAASCGRLLLLQFPESAERALRVHAGCAGSFVAHAPTTVELPAMAAQLLQQRPPPLPAAAELATLLDRRAGSAFLQVFGLITLYLLLLGMLLLRLPLITLLVLPLATSALALLSWSGAQPARQWVSWSETASGSTSARYSGLLRLHGQGAGASTIALPLLPQATTAPPDHVVTRADVSSGAAIEYRTRLLGVDDFAFVGVAGNPAPLSLAVDARGPRVGNLGNAVSRPAVLAWRGDKYVVPALAPGQSWQAEESQAETWHGSPAERLLRQRSLSRNAALLIELPANQGPPGFPTGRSYLMVTP